MISPLDIPNAKSIHGFFLIGENTFFAVHMLNSWMDCHRYQVILKISFSDDQAEKIKYLRKSTKLDTYTGSNEQCINNWYILSNNEKIPLTDIKLGRVTSFSASLYKGWPQNETSEHWPWANDEPLLNDVCVNIDRIITFRRLDFNQGWPANEGYLLYGEESEAFLSHHAIKAFDYDHLLTLDSAPSWLDPDLLKVGIPINFPNLRIDKSNKIILSPPLEVNKNYYVNYSGIENKNFRLSIKSNDFFSVYPFNKLEGMKPI